MGSSDQHTFGDASTQDQARAESPRLKLFINYRHQDTQGTAWALYWKLAERFGAENVFFDNGTLRPGMAWFEEIKSHLHDAGAFIVLIGSQWMPSLTSNLQHGSKDYVVEEIDLALQSRPAVTLVPVLVDEATPPTPDELPPALKPLPSYQVQRLRHTDLAQDIDRLITRLVEVQDTPSSEPAVHAEQAAPAQQAPPQTTHQIVPTSGHQVAPPPDDAHYKMVFRQAGQLVIFLGADANAEERDGDWREGAGMLPDDRDLAAHLAEKGGLSNGQMDLAGIAQYASALNGEPEVLEWVERALRAAVEPGSVHRSLARLPARLKELGVQRRYQMIVTPKYDAALEHAFRQANEPFDVAVYMAPGTEESGSFVHLPWAGEPTVISRPNDYFEFPISEDGVLMRTVIVRIHGAVNDRDAGFVWDDNYVITQDHYISYLSGHLPEEAVPAQILAKLRRASYLFLGYRLADWRLRVFLQRIWKGHKLGRAKYWAIERDPDELEKELWQEAGVSLFTSRLTEYFGGLEAFLASHADDLRV